MKPSERSAIIEQLKRYSAEGLNFEAAKARLLAQGYSEKSVSRVSDSYQYGAKQVEDPNRKITQYFDKHPDQAAADAAGLLKAKAEEDAADSRNQAVADGLASDFGPDLQSQVGYEYKYAQDIGMPFWLLVGIGVLVDVALGLLVTWLKINQWAYLINIVATAFILIVLTRRIR